MKVRTDEKLQRHMEALSTYKASLERRIEREMKKRMPCSLILQQLKRRKLFAKDGMATLHMQIEAANAKTAA